MRGSRKFRTTLVVSSLDALSTTTSSKSVKVCRSNDSSVRPSACALLNVGTQRLTVGSRSDGLVIPGHIQSQFVPCPHDTYPQLSAGVGDQNHHAGPAAPLRDSQGLPLRFLELDKKDRERVGWRECVASGRGVSSLPARSTGCWPQLRRLTNMRP